MQHEVHGQQSHDPRFLHPCQESAEWYSLNYFQRLDLMLLVRKHHLDFYLNQTNRKQNKRRSISELSRRLRRDANPAGAESGAGVLDGIVAGTGSGIGVVTVSVAATGAGVGAGGGARVGAGATGLPSFRIVGKGLKISFSIEWSHSFFR